MVHVGRADAEPEQQIDRVDVVNRSRSAARSRLSPQSTRTVRSPLRSSQKK